MRFRRAYIAAMCGGDKDCVVGVSSLTNEEPLVVVKVGIDIVREVIREDRGDSRGRMIGKREAPLCRGGCGSVREGAVSAENGDVGCGWGRSIHRGSEVFMMGGSDKDVVRVNGDVLVEWGKEESVENFLSDLGGSGRHC